MSYSLESIKNWSLRILHQRLTRLLVPRNPHSQSDKFVDLAPTSNADANGTYAEALEFATNNTNIFNIALTGPYGSGKSSVIKSYLKQYEIRPKRVALEISLASFVSDSGAMKEGSSGIEQVRISKQEIERSILQQMLYGADADRLPLSRFKRIQTPKSWALAVSLLIMIGSASVWHLFQHKSDILSGEFFKPFDLTNWLNLSSLVLGFLFMWLVIHRLYIQSFGISLKGVSLKNVEISPSSADEESILNKHLDEIIYFFQSTEYDLVIIEDLDRFDEPEIFVSLRELNKLINSNASINRHIRFLYALRDDIFSNTERTKFFEFIIPVIPIINHSNSIDMVLQHGQRLSLVQHLDQQFLREVSRYLNDLRLIRNIFNEYAIYAQQLEGENDNDLDPNKLLAVLVYKNVIPEDFELLHQQKGALSSLLNLHDDLVERSEADLKEQIAEIESDVSIGEKQLLRDVSELQKVYAMSLIERLPVNSTNIRFNNKYIPIQQLSNHEDFEQIIGIDQLTVQLLNQHSMSTVNLADFEKDVDERMTFAERREDLEKMSTKFVAESRRRIQKLRSRISELRVQPFSEAARSHSQLTEKCFEALDGDEELMKFLVFEGYLDDTYYQYISLFHEGRLSPYDNKFLRKIRGFSTPESDFQIDNPDEVIASMRAEDFNQSYVLNRTIFDYLLENDSENQSRLNSSLSYIAKNFEDCEKFFKSYYENGKKVPEFVESLLVKWPEFPNVSAESEQRTSHVARLAAYAPKKLLENVPFAKGPIAAHLSSNALDVMREGVDIHLSRLEKLNVKIEDLSGLHDFPKAQEFAVDRGLYKANIPNIRFVLGRTDASVELSSLDKRHYTTVLDSNNVRLQILVEADFDSYMRHVLLKLESNTEEEVSSILRVLEHDGVDLELLEKFWRIQSKLVPLLNKVPLHLYTLALEHKRIEPTWENTFAFFSSEEHDPEQLTGYLSDEEVMKLLLNEQIPNDEQWLPLCQYLLNNDGFAINCYRSYAAILPYKFKNFPDELSPEKLKSLIEEKVISFTPSSFQSLSDQTDLQILFAAMNFNNFINSLNDYGVDDGFLMSLLEEDISNEKMKSIILKIDPEYISTDSTRAAVVGPILDRTSFDPEELEINLLLALISSSQPTAVQISLLNKSQAALTAEQIRDVLSGFEEPYSTITEFGKSPKIPNTPANKSLAQWLNQRHIISSWKSIKMEKELRIHTFKMGEGKDDA